MPTVSELARITIPDGSVWRCCAGCGLFAALAPEVDRCEQCTTPTPDPASVAPAGPVEPAGEAGDMSTVRRITALLREIPPYGAPAEERATWFERKADVFDAIATQDPHLAEEAARLAEGARAHAEELRRQGGER